MRYITISALFVCFNLLSHAQDKWGLRQCVEYAWQNNISIKQQDVQARLAALSEKQGQSDIEGEVYKLCIHLVPLSKEK